MPTSTGNVTSMAPREVHQRHPGVRHLLEILTSSDELGEKVRTGGRGALSEAETVLTSCNYTAHEVAGHLTDGPELTAGLRHLLEARDCFVRQARLDEYERANAPQQ